MTAYTAPSFVVPGEADSATWNTEVLDNLRHLKEQDDARGIIARHVLTASSVGYTATGNSDMTFTADTSAGRLYVVRFMANAVINAAGRWLFELTVNGTVVARLGDADQAVVGWTIGGNVNGNIMWEPGALAAAVFRVRHTEISGTSTLTYNATATTPRFFYLEDVGPA